MADKIYCDNTGKCKKLAGYEGRGAKQKMLWALKQLNWGDDPTNPSFTYYKFDGAYYFESARVKNLAKDLPDPETSSREELDWARYIANKWDC
jgi:hypothetical protein